VCGKPMGVDMICTSLGCILLSVPLAHHLFSLFYIHTYIPVIHIFPHGYSSWPLDCEGGGNVILQNIRKDSPSAEHHIAEELNLHKHHCENLISHYVIPL
jgi:hypothetical protein